MSKVSTCLWFATEAEEAANFYVSLLPDSRIIKVQRSPIDNPSGKVGSVLVVDFELAGETYIALNGNKPKSFTQAISLSVECEDQAEVDRLWDAMCDGGAPVQCGWLTDRYGVSWQIVPKAMLRLLADPDQGRASRAMAAMMTMVKLDIAALETAADG